MGYSIDFRGTLAFTSELSAGQLAYLGTILGEDCRDHPGWDEPGLDYIDLALTDDLSGIGWDGSEKTCFMVECVNLVLRLMQEKWPEFGLSGELEAQGGEFGDWWFLVMEDGRAIEKDAIVMVCPECEYKWVLE